MASQTLDIVVKMRDAAGRGLRRLGGQLDVIKNKALAVQAAATGMQASIAALAAGVGIGLTVKSFIDAAAAFENYQTRLVRVLGSVEKGNQLFAEMKELAKESTAEYADIMASATNLAGVMEGGVEETTKYMRIIDDLAAVTGISIQETTSQVIRMYSAGAASADMFRDRGVLAMLGFQSGVHYTADETRRRLIAMYEDPASKIRNASKDLANTYQGMMSMLSDEWGEFQNFVMGTGVFDYIKATLATVIELIREFKKTGEYEKVGQVIGNQIAGKIDLVAKAAALALDAFRGWQLIITGLKGGFAAFSLVVVTMFEAIYDKVLDIIGVVRDLGVSLQSFAGTESLGKQLESIAAGAEASINAAQQRAKVAGEYWDEVLVDSDKHLTQLAQQESYWTRTNKLLDRIKTKAKEFRKATEEGPAGLVDRGAGGRRPEQASAIASLEAANIRMKAETSLAVTQLEQLYKEGSIALEDYFNEREKLIVESYAQEIALAKAQAQAASNIDKRTKAEAKVGALETKQQEELAKLHSARLQMEKDMAVAQQENAITLADLRTRIMNEGLAQQKMLHEQEILELQLQQEREIEMLRQKHATMDELAEAHMLHEKERQKQLADQEFRIYQMRLANAQTIAGGMAEVFGELYTQTGEEVKAFFYIQKAAAVAEAVINAHALAAKAMREGGTFAGPVLAALHFAKAMVHVSSIRSQRLAGGGEVLGTSPSPTADNIPIKATAGEYMQPVSAVKYYGRSVMEALRKRQIPREMFSGFALPFTPTPKRRYAFATGGAVSADMSNESGSESQREIKILNYVDQREMLSALGTPEGEDAVINVISRRRDKVSQVLR